MDRARKSLFVRDLTLIFLGFLLESCIQAKKIRIEESTVVNGDIYVTPKAMKEPSDETVKSENYVAERENNNIRSSRRVKRSYRSDQLKRTVALSDKSSLWDGGVLPYEISPNISERMRKTILTAIRKWEAVTCLRFVPAKEDEHDYSIFFENEGDCGCCSFIGKNYWKQELTLDEDGCNVVSTVLHEIGHAIGFNHEQTRPDRDKYIKVIYEHIQEENANQYEKMQEDDVNSLGFAYDFDSIMHYTSDAFTTGGETMIIIGNYTQTAISLKRDRHFLSKSDIKITNKLYKCPACLFNIRNKRGTVYFNTSLSDQLHCEWYIKREEGEVIEFKVNHFDIPDSENCTTDYLDFIDGYWVDSPYLDNVCGNGTVDDFYVTTSNYLLVIFERLQHSNFAEFSFTYKVACGREIQADEGTIKSPQNFPEDTPYSNDCVWVITVPEEYRVALHFETFNLGSKNCNSSYVQILDTAENNSVLHTFCGSEIPPDVLSPGNSIKIKFISDIWEKGVGFSASFMKEINECESGDNGGCSDLCVNTIGGYRCKCEEGRHFFPDLHRCEEYSNKCGGTLNVEEETIIASPSFPHLYPRNSKCTWEITNTNLSITFLYMDIEDQSDCTDKIRIIGTNSSKLAFDESYCGDSIPDPLNLTDLSHLKIEFESDMAIQNTGFAVLLQPL